MPFTLSTRLAPGVKDLDATLVVLEDGKGGCAEVWPALGFNCIRWTAVREGLSLDLLYRDPALFEGARPTRSGIPVLFPFPNRIRDGRFVWQGQPYQLPTNDPAGVNAIHGFACRRPWRIVAQGASHDSAWITGVFRCSVDDPASRPLWPADHEIRLTIRLGATTLRLEAEVFNPDSVPLPFGLGYHPYFRLPASRDFAVADCSTQVPAEQFWQLQDNLPTGERVPVDAARDLNTTRRIADLHLDDVLTGLPARPARMDGLIERATLTAMPGQPLRLFCSPVFREMVVFTPPHRQAFCIEPYTCVTDAINRSDGGLLVLPPGATWSSLVELSI
jgi:aldose 1-epimerase